MWEYAHFPNPSAFQRLAAHPPVAACMNLKGLMTDDRRHKLVWAVVQWAVVGGSGRWCSARLGSDPDNLNDCPAILYSMRI